MILAESRSDPPARPIVMLVFITTASHRYTIGSLLEQTDTPLVGRVITLSYGEFLSWPRLPIGPCVFADVDRLDAAVAEAVAVRITALQAAVPACVLLNHPLRSLGRLELLQRLHAAGDNDFQARRADQPIAGLRYPVFIREAIEHSGAIGDLIETETALAERLAALAAGPRPLSAYLIIEFIDVRNPQGFYEKYSVLRVGERLIASDLSFNDRWVTKGDPGEAVVPGDVERDAAFQRDNPHADALRAVFEQAGIDYGRADYAFADGRLQVFEINTNPMLPVPAHASAPYRPSTERYADAVAAAFAALPGFSRPERWQLVDGASGRPCIDGGSRARNAVRWVLKALRCLSMEPRLLRALHRLRR